MNDKTFEKVGDLFFDVSKLVIAGVILSNTFLIKQSSVNSLIIGIFATALLIISGLLFYNLKK